jgi:cyclic pyranopterin phosphate synthase
MCAPPHQVDEVNQEMAAVFGLPSTPDGTCLGPHQELSGAALDALLHQQAHAPNGPSSLPAPTANQQQQPALAAVLQQLQACSAQLQALQQQLHGTVLAAAGQQQQAATAAWQHHPQQSAATTPLPHQHGHRQQQHLSHVDTSGRATMVDVGGKPTSARVAGASCRVLLGRAAFDAVAANAVAKGDVLRVAQVAGIQGAKATPALIPLCHSIALSSVDVALTLDATAHAVDVRAVARAAGQTGVEMEALTAAAVAALTVYDMAKGVSKGIVVERLQLDWKEGGKSGRWERCGGEEVVADVEPPPA